jgi:SAM domain (Sterile alpha motif)
MRPTKANNTRSRLFVICDCKFNISAQSWQCGGSSSVAKAHRRAGPRPSADSQARRCQSIIGTGRLKATVMDVVVWLQSLGLGKYEAAFRENEIGGNIKPCVPFWASARLGDRATRSEGPSRKHRGAWIWLGGKARAEAAEAHCS